MKNIIENLSATAYHNKEAIEAAGAYICFYCCKIGSSTEDTCDNNLTVLCEHCETDACIPLPQQDSDLIKKIHTDRFSSFTAAEPI